MICKQCHKMLFECIFEKYVRQPKPIEPKFWILMYFGWQSSWNSCSVLPCEHFFCYLSRFWLWTVIAISKYLRSISGGRKIRPRRVSGYLSRNIFVLQTSCNFIEISCRYKEPNAVLNILRICIEYLFR